MDLREKLPNIGTLGKSVLVLTILFGVSFAILYFQSTGLYTPGQNAPLSTCNATTIAKCTDNTSVRSIEVPAACRNADGEIMSGFSQEIEGLEKGEDRVDCTPYK